MPPREAVYGAELVARRDAFGVFHTFDPRNPADERACATCRPGKAPWDDDEDAVPLGFVPQILRCPGQAKWWPRYVRRPVSGPLPTRWPGKGRVPRWFVWWSLYEAQSGSCAVCDRPPQVIDHDHESSLVRGLLCSRCNACEPRYAAGQLVCVHEPPFHFEAYWHAPPGEHFAWFWPPDNDRTWSFLTLPPL